MNATGKRSTCKLTKELRISEVERLTLLGWKKSRIARHLGCSERQVAYDRAFLCREYKEERLADQDEARDREHRRLLTMYQEAMNDWQNSKKRTAVCEACEGQEDRAKTCIVCEHKGIVEYEVPGNPEYLRIARGIVHDIRDLFGLNAPKKVEVNRQSVDIQKLVLQIEKEEQSKEIEQQLSEALENIPQLPPIQQPAPPQPNGNSHDLPNGFKELPPQ